MIAITTLAGVCGWCAAPAGRGGIPDRGPGLDLRPPALPSILLAALATLAAAGARPRRRWLALGLALGRGVPTAEGVGGGRKALVLAGASPRWRDLRGTASDPAVDVQLTCDAPSAPRRSFRCCCGVRGIRHRCSRVHRRERLAGVHEASLHTFDCRPTRPFSYRPRLAIVTAAVVAASFRWPAIWRSSQRVRGPHRTSRSSQGAWRWECWRSCSTRSRHGRRSSCCLRAELAGRRNSGDHRGRAGGARGGKGLATRSPCQLLPGRPIFPAVTWV